VPCARSPAWSPGVPGNDIGGSPLGVDPVWEIDSFSPAPVRPSYSPTPPLDDGRTILWRVFHQNTDKASTRKRRGLPISVADLPKSLQKVNLNAAGIGHRRNAALRGRAEGRDEVTVRCFWDVHSRSSCPGRLARALRHQDRGHGVDGGLLDSRLRTA